MSMVSKPRRSEPSQWSRRRSRRPWLDLAQVQAQHQGHRIFWDILDIFQHVAEQCRRAIPNSWALISGQVENADKGMAVTRRLPVNTLCRTTIPRLKHFMALL